MIYGVPTSLSMLMAQTIGTVMGEETGTYINDKLDPDFKYHGSRQNDARSKSGRGAHLGAGANSGAGSSSSSSSKSALLEEFLHGTQNKLGIVNRLGILGSEVYVKDFMIRHSSMLGLNQAEVKVLQQLYYDEIKRLNRSDIEGFVP